MLSDFGDGASEKFPLRSRQLFFFFCGRVSDAARHGAAEKARGDGRSRAGRDARGRARVDATRSETANPTPR